MSRSMLVFAIVLGSTVPALAQQASLAGQLLKQGYTIGLEHPVSRMFTLRKGSSSYACHYEDLLKKEQTRKPAGSAGKAEAWARVSRGASCHEI